MKKLHSAGSNIRRVAKASRKTGRNKLAFEGGLTYAKSSIRTIAPGVDATMPITRDDIITTSTVTAETLYTKGRYDRFLTTSNSLFVAVLASRDIPAGTALLVKHPLLGGEKVNDVGDGAKAGVENHTLRQRRQPVHPPKRRADQVGVAAALEAQLLRQWRA